jgi:hypothetical protein
VLGTFQGDGATTTGQARFARGWQRGETRENSKIVEGENDLIGIMSK